MIDEKKLKKQVGEAVAYLKELKIACDKIASAKSPKDVGMKSEIVLKDTPKEAIDRSMYEKYMKTGMLAQRMGTASSDDISALDASAKEKEEISDLSSIEKELDTQLDVIVTEFLNDVLLKYWDSKNSN